MSHNYLTNFLVPDRSFPALAYLNIRHNLFRWLPLEVCTMQHSLTQTTIVLKAQDNQDYVSYNSRSREE
jgi:hypothetical protein